MHTRAVTWLRPELAGSPRAGRCPPQEAWCMGGHHPTHGVGCWEYRERVGRGAAESRTRLSAKKADIACSGVDESEGGQKPCLAPPAVDAASPPLSSWDPQPSTASSFAFPSLPQQVGGLGSLIIKEVASPIIHFSIPSVII